MATYTYPPPLFSGGYYYPSPFPYTFSSFPAPPSSFYPAPAYGSPSVPSAATYHQGPVDPPACSYAATYPYPPTTSAYTPTSGFSPNWPIWPPPPLAPSTFPSTITSFSSVSDVFLPGATTPALPESTVPAAIHSPLHHHHFPPTTDHLQVQGIPQPTTVQTAPAREDRPPQRDASTPAVTSTSPFPEKKAHAKAAIRKNMASVLRNFNRRLDERQIQFASLQSEISKLVDMASSLNNSMEKAFSMVPSSASNTTAALTPSVGFAPTPGSTTMPAFAPSIFCTAASSPASSLRSPLNASATAYAVPQVLAEMPQRYGFDNLNHQTVFRADGSEHSYFALPEDYPLEQTNPPVSPSAAGIVGITAPQSVAAQAEGLAPVLCSKANNSYGSESLLIHELQLPMNVQDAPHVFKETYVHGIYEESSACLNITSDVPDFSLEQQQNDENASLNVQQLRDPQLSLLVTHEKTEVWDPGDNTILSSTVTRDIVDVLQTSILTTSGILALPYVLTVRVQFGMPTCVPQQSCYGRVPSSRKTNGSHFLWDPGDIAGVLNTSILTEETSNHLTECNSQNYLLQSAEIRYPRILSYFFILGYCSVKCNSWLKTVLQSMCDQVEGMNHLFVTTPWDPGVLVMYYGITCNSTRTTRDVEWLKMSISTSSELPQSVSVICSPFHMMRTSLNAIFSVQMMHYAIQRFMANISCKVAALTWHNSITLGSTASYIWDPGTMLLWYRFIWSLLTEGNEMGRLIPEQWSLRSNGMHYCQIFQKCNAMSSQLYWNQDIKLTGIDLWMIHFLPP